MRPYELHRMDYPAWEKYLYPEVCLVWVNHKDWKGWGKDQGVPQMNHIRLVSYPELK